jgi:hypothetical protein
MSRALQNNRSEGMALEISETIRIANNVAILHNHAVLIRKARKGSAHATQ